MHDCRETKDKIMDLVFDEIAPAERARLMADFGVCDDCQALYRSMVETLTVFDCGIEAGLPEEGYWTAYNEELRARITGDVRPTLLRRILDRVMSFNPLPSMPLVARAALALAVLAVVLWFVLPQSNEQERFSPPVIVDGREKDSQKNQESPSVSEDKAIIRQDESNLSGSDQKIARKPNRKNKRRVANIAIRKETVEPAPDVVSTRQRQNDSLSLLQRETASHIEMTEMLLRAFRNVSVPQNASDLDISYERELSKELLSRNMMLRRSASSNRNSRVEELLNNVEPVLLDIANLPDNPSQADVRSIKELMQRQAIIAELQFYSARVSSRSNR